MKRNASTNTRFLIQAALIAAIYIALTYAFAPISYGMLQVRISEVLTVLPIFTPAAIPGLFVGCLISNLYSSFGAPDIIFGSLATLIAAILTYVFRKNKYLAMVPPILVNAIMVGTLIFYETAGNKQFLTWIITGAYVGLGELIACYGLGIPFIFFLSKYKDKIFRMNSY